jgi:hypothetical protein
MTPRPMRKKTFRLTLPPFFGGQALSTPCSDDGDSSEALESDAMEVEVESSEDLGLLKGQGMVRSEW